MRILITGVSGFVGGHLVKHLQSIDQSYEIHGTVFNQIEKQALKTIKTYQLDLRNQVDVFDLISQITPDYIFHLAGQAFIPRSFEFPWETLENNIKSQLNILEACRNANITPRILITSSAEVHGIVTPDQIPIDESTPIKPNSPYSVSKVSQELLGLQYFQTYGIPIICVRPFNHIGPRQKANFVAPAFATQIAKIEMGKQDPIISVGDLTAQRDFTDVRDIVRAYQLILERGEAGAIYTVASGKSYRIQDLLDKLLSLSTVSSIKVKIDPARMRPSKVPILQGNYARLYQATGWQPKISFEQTLEDILNECRQRIKNEGEQ